MTDATTFTLSQAAQLWLARGERGISSEAIFSHLSGLKISDNQWRAFGDTPSDPADLRRCMLLLIAVPEFEQRFSEMKTRSKKWERLVENWSELTSLFKKEAGNQWRRQNHYWEAPETFEAMQKLGL